MDVTKLLECPVCLDEMLPPVKIFQCSNGHIICEKCKNMVKVCPTCRVGMVSSTRNILAENLADQKQKCDSSSSTNTSVQQHQEYSVAIRAATQPKEGIWTCSACTLLNPDDSEVCTVCDSPKPVKYVKALYDFKAKEENELTLKKGDIIKYVKKSDNGWSEGLKDGVHGFYPTSYAETVEIDFRVNVKGSVNLNSSFKVKALFDFNAKEKDEMSMKKGEIFTHLGDAKTLDIGNHFQEVDDGWSIGFKDNIIGLYPKTYVTFFVKGKKQ